MAQVHLHYPSFNAGELSPLLGARFGVEKVQSGCRRLRNFIIHPHGPAFRRPGLEWLGANAGPEKRSRLEGFNFSTTTGFILEFHPDGLQVWRGNERLALQTEVTLPYATEDECAEMQMVQVNDVCYLAHPNYAPRKLVRFADNDWRISEITWKWPPLGDENVRKEESTTPTITTLLTVKTEEWPEFTIKKGTVIFSVINPHLAAGPKSAKLQYIVSGGWVTKTISWKTSPHAPLTFNFKGDHVARLLYAGPPQAGSLVRVTHAGGTHELPTDIAQPESLQSCQVEAGDWQATLYTPPGTVTRASVVVERKQGKSWKPVQRLKPVAGQVVTYRGAKLKEKTEMRLNWDGRQMAGGVAKLEQVVFATSEELTLAVSETAGKGKTLTASHAMFLPKHVGSYWQIAHRRDKAYSELVNVTGAERTSPPIRVTGKWDLFTYGTWKATLHLMKKIGGAWEIVRTWTSNKDRNVIASGEEDQEVEMQLQLSAGDGDAASGVAVPRFVLEAADAQVYGLVKITAVETTSDTVKSTTATVDILTTVGDIKPTALWTEGAWSDFKGYPRTVALHGARLWFAGTKDEPQRVWGSVVNDYENFRRTSLDDASVSFTPAASECNRINWMISHEDNLILGTSGEEWTAGSESGLIRPKDILVRRRSNYGSRYVPALLINEVVVFLQRGGRKLRQITPRSDLSAWSAVDLTVLAEHVARAGVIKLAAMRNPLSILWAVTSDGKLLGMTFEQEQNVFGWHVHETDGQIESLAVIEGPDSDEVWLAVKRGSARSIERFDPKVFARAFESASRLIYLDAAVTRVFETPTINLIGLEHLEGREVAVLGDGAQQSSRVVNHGAIELETPARTVIVGLPFTSELQPMRVDIPLQDGTAQHRQFRVARVGLALHESLGGEIADAPGERLEKIHYRRASTPMDEPPPLFNGEVETALEARARSGVDVIVRQTAPLPLNIGAMTVKLDVYCE